MSSLDVVKLLLGNSASVHKVNSHGDGVLELAQWGRHHEELERIFREEHGAVERRSGHRDHYD